MPKISAIIWNEQEIEVGEIKFTPDNPRRITKEAFNRLKQKIKEQGYHCRLIVQPDLTLAGGNQRLRALQELGFNKIKVLVPSRELTPEEYRKLVITDNLQDGEWDVDLLSANYDFDELKEWGFPASLLESDMELEEDNEERTNGAMDDKICPHCGKNINEKPYESDK